MLLGLESSHVIALRCMKLTLGGEKARREAELMIREKIDEAYRSGQRLMAGASSDEIVRRYRRRVSANAKRLGRSQRKTRRMK
jgi:hypothetical protein